MIEYETLQCYLGMRFQITHERVVYWQPNRFTGRHGARYNASNTDDLLGVVLKERPKGSTVKLSRQGIVFAYSKEGIINLGKIDSFPVLDKLNVDPNHMIPGKIWVGPFDGEVFHFCDNRVWVNDIKGRRCHWKNAPIELINALSRYKPLGGSFIITPWNHVIALIEPIPLPLEAEEQWKTLTKDERRMIQIKQKNIQMLPIYVCKFNSEWKVALDEPVDFSKPLTKDEVDDMLDFLSQFSSEPKLVPAPEKDDSKDELGGVEEDWSEDDSFFEDYDMNVMFTPATMGEE